MLKPFTITVLPLPERPRVYEVMCRELRCVQYVSRTLVVPTVAKLAKDWGDICDSEDPNYAPRRVINRPFTNR